MTAFSPTARKWLFIAVVAVLTLGLRAWDLGGKSFWIDETATVYFSDRNVGRILRNRYEPIPPGYYLMNHFWISGFGRSEASLRVPSVIFGVAAVGLAGWVGFLLGGPPLGRLSVLLMAVSPLAIAHSQNARPYSILLAATLASAGCLLKWESRRTNRWLLAYLASVAVMCHAHFYGVLNLLWQNVYLGLGWRKKRFTSREWLCATVPVVFLIAPLLQNVIAQAARYVPDRPWLAPPGAEDVGEVFGRFTIFQTDGGGSWWVIPFLSLALIGALCAGWRSLKKPEPPPEVPMSPSSGRSPSSGFTRDHRIFLALWLSVPIILPFLLAHAVMPKFGVRYTIAALPAFYLLIGAGILTLRQGYMRWTAAAGVLAVSVVGLPSYFTYEKENWRDAIDTVNRMAGPGDPIVFAPAWAKWAYLHYGDAEKSWIPVHEVPSFTERRILSELAAGAGAGQRTIWVLIRDEDKLGRSLSFRADPYFLDFLELANPELVVVKTWEFDGAVILRAYRAEGGRRSERRE
jgi:uncharacterized membrane protein